VTLYSYGSTFTLNSAVAGGAVLANVAYIHNSTFSGNVAQTGGAVRVAVSVDITTSTFSNNTASVSGGAIYSGNSVVTHGPTIFTNNMAITKGGGAIYTQILTTSDAVFDGNYGQDGGAVFLDLISSPNSPASFLNYCTFDNNNCAGNGSSIFSKVPTFFLSGYTGGNNGIGSLPTSQPIWTQYNITSINQWPTDCDGLYAGFFIYTPVGINTHPVICANNSVYAPRPLQLLSGSSEPPTQGGTVTFRVHGQYLTVTGSA